jgi:predicted RNase H-like HicB family nuclease
MALTIAVQQDEDGRWQAQVMEMPDVLASGQTCAEAVCRAQALTLRRLADRVEQGEEVPHLDEVFAVVF